MAKQFDVIVIGAGPGGYTAALKAAEFGLKVAVIETKKIGGTCVNRGCIPTKALLYASGMFRMMQNCDEFGVSTDFISFDFQKMQSYKKKAVDRYRGRVEGLFEENHVEVIYGKGTLRRGRTVEVELAEGGREFFEGKTVILAAGAVPMMNEIPGADLPGVWNSDRLLAAKSWNFDRLTIMGGGVIAVEFATLFNNLCSNVTIVEKKKHLMAPMDDVMSTALERVLRRKGIQVYCDSTVTELSQGENGLNCVITPNKGGEPIRTRAGQVLMAIGRKPNVQGLCGPDVSLEMKNGKIAVSPGFETSEPGVYAIGDVCADIQLAHVAAAQGTYVVEKLPAVLILYGFSQYPAVCMFPFPLCLTVFIRIRRLLPLALRRRKRACGGLRCDVVIFPWRKMDVPLSQGNRTALSGWCLKPTAIPL